MPTPRRNILAILILFLAAIALFSLVIQPRSTVAEKNDYRDDQADGRLVGSLTVQIDALGPLHKPMPKPGPGDWLAQHKEHGQTFLDYVRSDPVRPLGKRNTIYIQPLGDFTKTQRKIVELTADYMSRYFNCPVKISKDLPLDVIPEKARRVHPSWGMKQILSTYVLTDVLKPKLPEDAAASLAFTATDLWPGEGWNFVFGQASLNDRVGVWSIYRNGDPDKSEELFKLCLRRTLKVATHETGHMFSMWHCIAYECNMNGSNNLGEADKQPLWLCPQCMSKACWAARVDPVKRFEKLKEFCEKNELKEEAAFFGKAMAAVKKAE
ncbi:MAG: archaemetzincin [Phycisphaeraceae bacterium]